MPPRKERAPPREIDESLLVPGTLILFRLKGYPPWPSVIVTEEHIPPLVQKKKPPSGKAYPVRFFPLTKAEFGWATIKTGEINAVLSKEEIDAFVQNPKKGTSKQCLMAYQAAAEPLNLDELKFSEDVDMEDAGPEPEDEDEGEEDDAPLEDIKDLYDDEDDEEGTGKKRKRRATDDGEQKSKKKKPSVVEQPKKKKTKAQQNGTAPKERKKPGPKPKPKVDKQAEEEAAAAKKKVDEEKKAEYRKKEIMYIRHRIQKILLDKSGKEPEQEELPHIVDNLKKLGEFNWITPILIAETKIHKVLKRIVALPSIPHDEKDEIKTRAHNILKAWTAHLDEIAKTEKKDAPATDEKRGSGSDGEKEKSPVVEKNGPEPPKVEEPAKEEVAGDQRVRASPEKEEVGEPMAVDEPAKEVVAEEEDFVMVDGGGEGDELAQEKAAAQDPVVEQPKPQVEEKKEAPVVGGTLEPAASSVVPPE